MLAAINQNIQNNKIPHFDTPIYFFAPLALYSVALDTHESTEKMKREKTHTSTNNSILIGQLSHDKMLIIFVI